MCTVRGGLSQHTSQGLGIHETSQAFGFKRKDYNLSGTNSAEWMVSSWSQEMNP